jgi:hypothetical protein
MKVIFNALFAALLALLVPFAATAQNDDGLSGSVEIGAWDAEDEGSPDVVSEYLPNDGGAFLKLDVSSVREGGAIDLGVEAFDSDDYKLGLDLDALGRSIRSSTALTGLIHRLQHESLAHFSAATAHGRLTRHTDFDPDDVYGIDYSVLAHRTEFQPQGASGLTFAVGYRQQEREGTIQSTTISHCSSCHVVSQSRPIDESTTDVAFDASFAWEAGQIAFSANTREFETDPTAISLLFDDAIHPELLIPVFDNRLQYDSAEGRQPVDRRSETSKDTYRLDGTFATAGGFVIGAEGVSSTTTNDFSGRESDFSGFLVTAGRNFGNDWSFRWRGRSYTVENDDYFVNLNHRLGIAGPQAGRTYEDIYGLELDLTSQSALNRDVIESKFDLTKRFGRKKGSARFFWKYEDVDREYFEVAVGTTGTSTNIIGASWWARPKKGWKTNVLAQHGESDDPFMNVNGQYSTLVSPGPLPSPFDPQAAQYYEFQGARIADTTASAASWDELELRGSYTTGITMVSASYRYWDGDNDNGDLTDWAKTQNALNVSVWSAPSAMLEWQIAYTMSETEIDAPASIPLFDG